MLAFVLVFSFACKCPIIDDVTTSLESTSRNWKIDACCESSFDLKSNGATKTFNVIMPLADEFDVVSTSRRGKCVEGRNERFDRVYTASDNTKFSIKIYPYTHGDEISVEVNGLFFTYNFQKQLLIYMKVLEYSKSKTYYSDGSVKGDEIASTLKFYTNFDINGKIYENVMHFQLRDFAERLTSSTTTDIYIAQHNGLVKYRLFGGLEFVRE